MRSKQKVIRLNESSLRKLVREMMNSSSPVMTKDQAYDRAEQFNLDYIAEIQHQGQDRRNRRAIFKKFSSRLKAEVEELLPMLGDGDGSVKVIPGYDGPFEIQIQYTQYGLPQRFSGDLVELIGRIDWPA